MPKPTHVVIIRVTKPRNKDLLGGVFPVAGRVSGGLRLSVYSVRGQGQYLEISENKIRPITPEQFLNSNFRKTMKAFYGNKDG